MRIGVGIPNSIPGTEGRLLLEWARRAEALGFSSLSTIGRVAYPSFEELTVLAAAAGVTKRIGLLTAVLLGPTREPVLLAKSAASLDQLSEGRLVLGLGVGGRQDDFEASGKRFEDRGARWDRDLELIHRAWRGEPVGGSSRPVTPSPVRDGRVPILIGGRASQAVRRTVRWGAGWIAGGGGPDMVVGMFEKVRAAWKEAGREGQPDLRSLQYFALGPDAEAGREYLMDYYGPFAERMWQSVPRDPEAIRDVLRRFEEAGADEVLLSPTIASLHQVELLAEAVFGAPAAPPP
jgi:alkanesulfonate monooxygenase SsuD/methylene tetrahydromethanopterin reductase-like flavin-dependent oxidoreductase (luciferase family)